MFVGRKRLETAAFDAAIVYNDGEMGRMEIFSNLGLANGNYMKGRDNLHRLQKAPVMLVIKQEHSK